MNESTQSQTFEQILCSLDPDVLSNVLKQGNIAQMREIFLVCFC